MQKRKTLVLSIVYSAVTALVALSVLILSSFAWYGNLNAIDLETIDGTVAYRARYFESGDGSVATQMVSGYDSNGDPVFINGYNSDDHASFDAHAAFEIKTPDQLYNLAWLQFMGYFNAPDTDNGNIIPPTYFYLSADLDMTGYILPPVGTSRYPFIGNFDGNGHTISNLTVSNTVNGANGLTEIPRLVREEIGQNDISNAEIVGFFGVLGKPSTDSAAAGTITVNGTAYSYSSAETEMHDVTLADIKVCTQTARSLAGLAVGYVNGPVSGVAVDGGQLVDSNGASALNSTDFTSNLSDYSLVGFAEEAYRATTDVCSVTHEIEVETCTFQKIDTGDAWGGSIDMYSLYQRIGHVYDATKSNTNLAYYYTRGLKVVDADGNETITYDESSRTRMTTSFSSYNSTWTGYYNYNWDGYSSYSFPRYNDTKSDTFGYNMLYGGDNTGAVTTSNTALTMTVQTWVNHTGVYISHNGNYLNLGAQNGNYYTITGGTTPTTAWAVEGNHVYTAVDGVPYYLDYNNGTFRANTTEAVAWTVSSVADGSLISNNGSYMYYDTANSRWALAEIATSFYIKDTTNGYYLNRDGTTGVTASTTRNTRWVYDENGYLYTVYNNQNYYLNRNGNNVALSTTRNTVWSFDGTYFTTRQNNTTYYLRFEMASIMGYVYRRTWNVATSGDYRQMTVEDEQPAGDTSNYVLTTTATDIIIPIMTETTQRMASPYLTNDSILPITITNGNTNGPVYTTDTQRNTGYFVSGAENDGEHIGNLRVAQYPMSQVTNAFAGDTYVNAQMEILTRTAQSGGIVRITDTHNRNNTNVSTAMRNFTRWNYSKTETNAANTLYLAKYTDSRDAVKNVFDDDPSHVYGIHFMNAAISKDNVAIIPTAYINGDQKTNFEVPRNSIDFTLRDSGFINFFAHTGYVNTTGSGNNARTDWTRTNNTFFSLHHIYRDAQDHITEIKEIRHVYKAPDGSDIDYIYQYVDGKWSDLTRSIDQNNNVIYTYGEPTTAAPAHGAEVFDTAWITAPGMTDNMLKTIFYFEVPANPGEYALGSVGGTVPAGGGTYAANGAYLFYLDISANAHYIERTTTIETVTTVTDTYEYPAGVDFATVASSVLDATATISRPANDSGTVTYSKSGSAVTASGKNNLGSTYAELGTTVSDGDGEITPTPKSTVTTVQIIKTVRDYNTSTHYTMTEVSTGDSVSNLSVVSLTSDDPTETNPVMQAPTVTDNNENPVAAGTDVVSYQYVLPANSTVTTEADYIYRSFANYPVTRQSVLVNTDDITLTITGSETTVQSFALSTSPINYTGKVTMNTETVTADSEITLTPSRSGTLNNMLADTTATAKRVLRSEWKAGTKSVTASETGSVTTVYNVRAAERRIGPTIIVTDNFVIPEIQKPIMHSIPRIHVQPEEAPEAPVMAHYFSLYRTELANGETLAFPALYADTQIDCAFYAAPIALRSAAAASGLAWDNDMPEGVVALIVPANAEGTIRMQTAGSAQPTFVRADGTTYRPTPDEEGAIALNQLLFGSAAWNALDAEGAICTVTPDTEPAAYVLLIACDAETEDTALTELQLRYMASDAIRLRSAAFPAAASSYVTTAVGEKLFASNTEGVYSIAPAAEEKPAEETPADPANPGETTDPTNPENPGTTEPLDPENPGTTEPLDPENPGTTEPLDPENPGTTEPLDPENPGTTEPLDPENPGTTEPTDPENPGTTEPTDPENPGTTEPTNPENPVTTTDPALPVDPSEPGVPEIPDAPEGDGKNDGQPETNAAETTNPAPMSTETENTESTES